METGVVTIQEPVSTKTDVGGAPAGVILDKSSMEVHNINLSTVLDDEITSGDRRSNIVTGEADVNGSGNKETEELKSEKGEATKTISVVDDSQIVNDDQGSFFIHEPQSFNKATEDENIILSDVTLEKKKEDDITGKPEEVSVEKPVIEEDHTETKHLPEQEEETANISKDREEIPIKTEKVKEETDSSTVETSVNGTEAEHNATVSVEEISRNGDNIVNETVPEDQTATDGEPLHDVETTKTVLLEVKKEEEEEAEPLYKTVVEDANIVTNEETAAHESKILKEDNHQEEDAEPVEAIKNSEDAEQISREVTVDKQKEEDIIKNTEEVQESPRVIETPTKEHEDEMDKISKDTAEHEHLLVRDVPVPQGETLVTEAETADTPTVQEARILKTNINETEAVHSDEIGGEEEGQETKENTKPSKDLKDDKEQEETETVKTIISSDEVRSSDVQAEVYGEHSEPYNSEIKDESYGREESIELKSKETVTENETAAEAEDKEDKEVMKIDKEQRLNAIEKAETETVKTIIEDPEIVNNEETTVHESESLKENAEPLEAVKNSDDEEKISREVTVDRGKEEDITQKTEEIQERPSVIETSKIQGEDIESKASLELEEEVDHSSKDTEEHEQVLERDVPQCETLEAESVETKEDTKPSLDLKEDKEKEETETVKTAFSSDEVRSSAVQEEEFGEHTEPCSSEIKDESHGREESVEVKSQETVQDENIEEKHEDLLDVPSTESEKYQDNESETVLVSNTESYEKSEESPSDLALNVDKEELNDEKINVDQVDGTQIMEEHKGLDSNGAEAEQIDRNRTDETEESSVAKPVALPDVESMDQMQKPTLESTSVVSEESSKTVDEKTEEKIEEEVTFNQEGQVDGSSGLETKEETVSVPKSIELGEQPQEERSVIDPNPLQEESSQPNEQEKETKLEPTNEEVKSDEVIKGLSASPSKELEGETVVEAEKIENIKEYEEEQAADKIQKSLETVETVECHSSLPSFSEEQEHGDVSEKIEAGKVKEEPMLQIKSEDDATKSHERQEEFSKDVETKETTVFQAEQTRDIEPSLTEKCSMDQSQPEEQEKELSRNSENVVNETYALHSVEAAEEETATNGESLHDVETTKSGLLEVEKEEEEAEIKTDAETRLDAIEKEEIETVQTVVEGAKIDSNEETTSHESKSFEGDNHQENNAEPIEATKHLDDAEQISREVTVDKQEDITEKIEKVQESPTVIETPTIQGEEIEEEHEHVLERDIPQCETLEAEAVDTSTVQEAEILKTWETNISETEAVHSETSLDLKVDKEQKEAETVKTDEVKTSDQADAQAEEFGEHTEPCSLEIKDKSQGREESVEVNSKESVQDESSEEKDVNLLDVRSGESEKYQENEPDTSLVSKTKSGDKFEEIPSVVESAGLDDTTHNKTLADVVTVEKVQKPSLETPFELPGETGETINEQIEEKTKEEVTLRQEGEEEGSNGLETKEETVLVPESRELGEQAHEEELCLQNEQENEKKLQKEQVEKHEHTKEEVSNDQQSPAEETSDKVIQVSSTSSEGPGYETVVEAKNIGEEQVADEIKKSFETVETVEPHSSLLSSSKEKEHETVSEKTDEEKVRDAEPTGDMSEKGLEISETTPLSLSSVDHKEDVKALDKEIHVSSVGFPLDEQEKVTSTEKGETKANETEDDKPEEHVNSSTSPLLSEKNDNETQTSETKKGDEEITVGTSTTSEDVCMQQEAPKLEESKEDKGQEISAETTEAIEATSDQTLFIEPSHADHSPSSELVSGQVDQTPKQVEEIHEEEHEVEAMGDRDLPVETSHADNTSSPELVSELHAQTPVKVEKIHEEETKEAHKLHAEEILPTEIIPRESSDDALVSMLASKEDGQVALQEDNYADGVRETKDIQEERSVSVETEVVGATKPKEPEDEIRDEHVETPTSPIILEENDSETLIAEAKKGNEDINETEKTMALESSSTSKRSENVSIKQEDFVNHEAPKLEETKEEKSQEIPETAKAIETTIDQTPSLVSDKDDQTPKEVEEILEEETKETHQVQAEPILSTETVPRESFIEAPVSMLSSGEDEPVTPQEGDYAGNTQEEPHVSVETKSKELEAEGIEKSDDQVEDESTKKTDVEVAELAKDNPTEEAEHGDETYSTLPVVGILTQLQTTLETERAIDDSASSGENSVKEPTDQEQKKSDVEVESNEKDSATGVIEANMLQHDESGETEKIQEENGLAGKSLPIEEISLQEAKVQDGISREFEVNVEEKLQEETREIAECKEEIPEVLPGEKIVIPSSALPSEELEDVNSAEKQEEREPQQDVNASTSEKQEETHETVKEEDQIVEIIDEKKNEEVQYEKLKGLSATRDIEEIFSSEVKEDASELGVGHDVVTPEVEKEEEPHSVLGNVEEINESVTSEKQITDPVGVIKKASEAEPESHVETQAISDDTKSNNGRDFPTEEAPKDQSDEVSADESLTKEAVGEQLQVPSSTVLDDFQENSNTEAVTDLADRDLSVQNPSELIQSHQSPNQVEETSFEVEKAQEDKNEETVDTLITNVQVQDQPKEDFEAPAIEKEISEQEQKSNDLTDVQEDIGTYVKVQVPDDKLGDEDAIKDGVTVEEKNNTSENIDHEAAKEIYQEESKQTDTVKEEIKEKEINQESFNNMKKTDDVIDKTQPEIPDIECLSSVSKTQYKPEQKDEVPNQQEREIAAEVPKLENPKIAEELQQKDGESENTKDLFSEVKETEPTLKEPARKSLSDHIQKVKGTNKIEDATTEPHTEEEHKTEEDENDDEDHEHKDDKTSPDSIVMVEAKDTVSIIKTHKKSQGILSGVGSKVKQSISKVKKVLTGKSSHTTKPSSPDY